MKHPYVHPLLTCIQMTIPVLNLLSPHLPNYPNAIIWYILEKLHFTTLNYIINYTLYLKLFEYIFYTINYDSCYTLHPDIKFAINFDLNPKFMVQSVIKSSLRWYSVISSLFLRDWEEGQLGSFIWCHTFPFKLMANLTSRYKVQQMS